MKKSVLFLIAAAVTSFSAFAFADEMPVVKNVIININDAFIPGGFDSETDAYVIVNGLFPNGCYRWKDAQVNHVSAMEHQVTSVAAVSQGMCLQVLVPFSKDIKLGKLAKGKHTLKFLSGDGTYLEKNLVVE